MSISHSSVWFITFTAATKSTRAAELCLTLPKYNKTFDSPQYTKYTKFCSGYKNLNDQARSRGRAPSHRDKSGE